MEDRLLRDCCSLTLPFTMALYQRTCWIGGPSGFADHITLLPIISHFYRSYHTFATVQISRTDSSSTDLSRRITKAMALEKFHLTGRLTNQVTDRKIDSQKDRQMDRQMDSKGDKCTPSEGGQRDRWSVNGWIKKIALRAVTLTAHDVATT